MAYKNKLVTAVAAGAAAGAGAGLMFAPKTGHYVDTLRQKLHRMENSS